MVLCEANFKRVPQYLTDYYSDSARILHLQPGPGLCWAIRVTMCFAILPHGSQQVLFSLC